MNNKKTILIISVSALLLVLIGVGIYFLTKNKNLQGNTGDASGFLNPGGNNGTNNQTRTDQNSTSEQPIAASTNFQSEAQLVKISDVPVSGFTVFDSGSSTIIRYIERSTGNLYEVNTTLSQKNRISNTTIPKVEEVVWGSKGNSLALRYSKDGIVLTNFATVSSSTASSTSEGSLAELTSNFLAPNLKQFVFSPKKDKVLYTTTNQNGISLYTNTKKTTIDQKTDSLVWVFPTTEWLLSWPSDSVITATTKASNGVLGYMLEINPSTKRNAIVLNGIEGLTTLTNNLTNWTLYSKSTDSETTLSIYDPKAFTHTQINPTTLPEKCVWTNKSIRLYCGVPKKMEGKLPDDWYQGLATFSDSITLYDPNTGWGTDVVGDLESLSGTQIDVVNPQLNNNDTYLVFMNKKDLSLWVLKIDPSKKTVEPATPTQP